MTRETFNKQQAMEAHYNALEASLPASPSDGLLADLQSVPKPEKAPSGASNQAGDSGYTPTITPIGDNASAIRLQMNPDILRKLKVLMIGPTTYGNMLSDAFKSQGFQSASEIDADAVALAQSMVDEFIADMYSKAESMMKACGLDLDRLARLDQDGDSSDSSNNGGNDND